MKTELQAQMDYKQIEQDIKSLAQKITSLQYDEFELSICGDRIKAKLIETPGYRTISHNFNKGVYKRVIEV